jgi:multidrug efflux pump subunit AcrB
MIRVSLRDPIALTAMTPAAVMLGVLATIAIPEDNLPVLRSPAVQVLTIDGAS